MLSFISNYGGLTLFKLTIDSLKMTVMSYLAAIVKHFVTQMLKSALQIKIVIIIILLLL